MPVPEVRQARDRTATIGTMPVFWHEAPTRDDGAVAAPARARDGETPRDSTNAPRGEDLPIPLYLHGVPTCADEWLPFLARTGGLAPDLPGFGRTGKAGNLDYTIDGYADFLERYLDLVGVSRVSLVVHDWGAVGLAFAQRHLERVARLVVIDAVPFLPGYRWHRVARRWRTPVVGELTMGATTRLVLRQGLKVARPGRRPMTDEWLDMVFAHFDQGTQRAILRLYRASPPDVLAAAGRRLGELTMPALVLWGGRDPYIPARFGRAYAEALPNAQLVELPDAGHWPWLDRPDAIGQVADFLGVRTEGV